MWRLLTKYLKPYWKATLLAPLLMLIEVYMDLLQPKLMASIVDHGVLAGDLAHIQSTGAQMLGVALIGLVGGVGCTVFSSIASQHFGADVRNDLFQKVQTFSFRKLEQFKTGSLITRLTNDVSQAQMFVQMLLRVMVRAPLLSVGSLIMAFTISIKLAVILIIVIPILFAVLFVIIRKGFPLFSIVQSKLDGVNNVLQENLSGIRVVKAFVRSDYERGRFGAANDDYMAIAVKANIVMASMMPIMLFLLNTSVVAVLWFGGHRVWDNSIPVGDLVAFINYVTQVLFSMLMVGMMMMNISRAKASSDRIQEVLDADSEIKNKEHAKENAVEFGRIVFDDVSFAYDEDEVLRHISFQAEPGQTVAILGATGSGKSSLIGLIPRLYETTEGRVLIDGTDVKDMNMRSLRSRIGMVLQEAILFSGTIRDNIAFGKPDATQEEVEAAAQAAQAHEFIMKMPDGYDTVIGQRGINLSGGQKQRVSIARALLIDPVILILDDSTSAVDMGTESRIQKALKAQIRRSTSLIIAQRISSVLEADKIIVLDEGAIVAEGTHRELLQSCGVYQEIYRSQLGKEDVLNV
ncbi:ABC transporter ATP-binding protein [Paenibacillus allorhizosphaerae]|uniref:ABC transporter ATP-binding protein n=1 Tax=Paenibacillus allorhizosphaerae TaxID=2849866 RepID=A0ABM8VBU7_9BACL|nr:ABC transporter ATP-binding protein [Paenibacillus allorhizosphaerae]CAG7618653.1 putative ABC transporter ATP-binding protein [Paenibacillus allorhizosphaerae]